MRWYSTVTKDYSDIDTLLKCLDFYEAQYLEAQEQLRPTGRIYEFCAKLPGMVEYRYGQLQELEAILKFYERHALKVKLDKKRHFLEHYNRTLSDRQADQYAEIQDEVQLMAKVVEEISLVRNKFLGLTKGYEYLHFQIGNMVHIRKAGIEDALF